VKSVKTHFCRFRGMCRPHEKPAVTVAPMLALVAALAISSPPGPALAQEAQASLDQQDPSGWDNWAGPQAAKGSGGADEQWLSGYLMLFNYMDATRAMYEAGFLAHEGMPQRGKKPWFATDRGGVRLQLRAFKEFSDSDHADVTFNTEYDVARASRQPDSSVDDGVAVYFKEGFLSVKRALPFLDLKLGRQYIFWGRFEWGGAMDVVSGWDFTNMSADKENYRTAVDAIQATFVLGPVSLETVLLPYFVPNRIPLEIPDKVGPVDAIQNEADLPERSWENAEFGARLTVPLGTQSEVSLSAFSGFDRAFSIRTTAIMEEGAWLPTAIEFTPEYARLTTVGIDGEWAVGPLLLLLESGLFLGEDWEGNDLFRKNSQVKTVAGFEVEPHSKLTLQGQFSHTHLLNYDRQQEYDGRQAMGEPDPYVPGPNQYGFNYKVQWKVADSLAIHLLHMMTFPDSATNDMMLLMFGAWEPYDAMKVYIGTVLFRGAEETTFGRLEEQGRFFFEVRQFF